MAYEKEIEKLIKKAQELLDQAEELKAKAKEEADIGLCWRPEKGELFWVNSQNHSTGKVEGHIEYVHSNGLLATSTVPVFRTRQQAEDFAEAWSVMLELRSQKGVVNPVKEIESWGFTLCDSDNSILYNRYLTVLAPTLGPSFKTEHNARVAVANVGRDRVIKAFKTLMFISK